MQILDINTGKGTSVIFDSLTMVVDALKVSASNIPISNGESAIITLDVTRENVALGAMFVGSVLTHDSDPIGDNQDLEVLITTPTDKHVHMEIEAAAGGASEFHIYENPTITDNGSGIYIWNKNRDSSDLTNTVSGYSQPSWTYVGVPIVSRYIPGGTILAYGGESTSTFVFDNDEDYILQVTNRAGTAQPMSIKFQFYTHDV